MWKTENRHCLDICARYNEKNDEKELPVLPHEEREATL